MAQIETERRDLEETGWKRQAPEGSQGDPICCNGDEKHLRLQRDRWEQLPLRLQCSHYLSQ